MIRRRLFKRRHRNIEIDPDEIFMDSSNIPQFDQQQFEGRLEQPISKSNATLLGLAFLCIGIIFAWKVSILQISKGTYYVEVSEKNSLKGDPIFADRGVIFDRNNVELAWNVVNPSDDEYLLRQYIDQPGFSNLVGYVSYPSKDNTGHFWQTEYIGKDGIEEKYNEMLSGQNGKKLFETDARGNVHSVSGLTPPVPGENAVLSIDARLQAKMFESIRYLAERAGYRGGAGLIMDVYTGELLVATTYPEYSSKVMTDGTDKQAVQNLLLDTKGKPFLFRAVTGAYTPGSIVKPFVSIGALNEGIVDPNKSFLSTGQLVIPNPYNPEMDSIFRDWKKEGHGYTDMRKGLAESVNTYFYIIGGGYKDQKGLGIHGINKYAQMFGIGSAKTGVDIDGEKVGNVPSVEWKAKLFPGDPWRLGDTYHTAIGQYGFQVTPIQMLRAIAGIATRGTLVTPHVLKDIDSSKLAKTTLDIPSSKYTPVQEGMRMVVTAGTAQSLNIPEVHVAAKTGTAQVGVSKSQINSWAIGFFPYEHPRYAFTVLMESSPSTNKTGAANAIADLLKWMAIYSPEYLNDSN